jgi:hypothetical protein
MSPTMEAALARFRQYPPLLQWFLIGAVVVIVLIFWSFLVWDTAKAWSERADEYAAALERSNAVDQRIGTMTQLAILALGETEPIGNSVEGEQALSALIIEVLTRNHVTGRDVQRKESVGFRGEAPPIFPSGQGERAITEVRFEATPEAAFRVVSELESSPLVETVSKVQIGKGNDTRRKTVVVNLTVEAWVSPGAPPTRQRQPSGTVPAETEMEEDAAGAGDDVAASANEAEGSAIP